MEDFGITSPEPEMEKETKVVEEKPKKAISKKKTTVKKAPLPTPEVIVDTPPPSLGIKGIRP